MKKVLLATLGESPAVVTEAIDRLQKDGIFIDYVVLFTTNDAASREATYLLSAHLPKYYGEKPVLYDIRILDKFFDVDSDESAVEFMEQACSALRDYRKKSWEVYVCIAGGRKAMSALLTLAVQFHGAQRLFHVLVADPELEEEGHVLKLRNKTEKEQNRVLHPGVEKIKLVNLPFIGIFPLMSEIVAGLKGEDVSSGVKDLLSQNGLLSDGGTTGLGKLVLGVLERVEALPDPREGECEISLAKKEPKEKEETEKWAKRLANRFLFIKRIEDIGWKEGESRVKVEENFLTVFLPGRKVQGIGFRLTTTAKTEGQLERAMDEIERWIEKEKR